MQRQIALMLREAHDALPECVTAFRKKSSAFENAKRHANQLVVVTADLADFYGSITLVDVAQLFEQLGAGRVVAVILARLSTLDEKLIQGGRASPFIANLVGHRLDNIILAKIKPGCRYTRYVDDLTFSGAESVVPSLIEIASWVRDARFELRPNSYSSTKQNAGPFVTGLNVAGEKPRISRRLRRQIDAFLHYASSCDISSAAARTFKRGKRATDRESALQYVQGLADWVRVIDEALSRRWATALVQLRGIGSSAVQYVPSSMR
jgi:RNA-directed DNA polymerase